MMPSYTDDVATPESRLESLFQTDSSLGSTIEPDQHSSEYQPDTPTSTDESIPAEAAITVITSPRPVTKSFSLSSNGDLVKETAANVADGTLSIRRLTTLEEFGNLLHGLNPYQCITYGVPKRDGLKLMSTAALQKAGRPDDATARTKTTFNWPSGSGILMLDYDAPKDGTPVLTRQQLFDILYATFPTLKDSDALWMPSTSSEIYNADTNAQLTGIKGQRIYFMLQDASDIPRAGKALLVHLWAAGHGRFEVSSSGSLLERGLFDASVWQTNRIDFAGGAQCAKPLEQRRGTPILSEGTERLVDSRVVFPDPSSDILANAEKHKTSAKLSVTFESQQKRKTWETERISDLKTKNPHMLPETIQRLMNRAVDDRRLIGEWQITVVGEDGSETVVPVDELLANAAKYDGLRTLDPLEPDYDGRRPVGKLFLFGRPCLFSLAHGGTRFSLAGSQLGIEIVKGRECDSVDKVLQTMRTNPDVYDFGSALVTVSEGRTRPMNEINLRYWLGSVVQFSQRKSYANGQHFEVLEDPPGTVCKAVLALGSSRNLKRLTAVITAPTLRQDGSILSTLGFDDSSGLLLDSGDEITHHVPTTPTEAEAQNALETLWHPFKNFPFVDELAQAAHASSVEQPM